MLHVLPTRRGARLLHAGHVVSEVIARPGPTHSLFDIMAACATTLAVGPRLLLLGFGGGSIVAPLRALGWPHPIEAVDLSAAAADVYRRLSSPALGDVNIRIAEASAWLARSRRRYDVIVEDLSLPVPGDLVMPPVCFEPLPRLIARRLAPNGVAIINVFSPEGGRWRPLCSRLLMCGFSALVIEPHAFDHRLLVLGRRLPQARAASLRVRSALTQLRSRQAQRLGVRRLG